MNRTTFDPVKVGVVGLGHFGRQHALTLACLTEAKLVALVARRQASLDTISEQLPSVSTWTDLDRAIAESDAEAWVVASSTSSHVALTTTLLREGKAVLLEKPIANNLAEAQTLAPLVMPNSSNLMLGHIVLFNSEFLQLQDEVRRRAPITYLNGVRHRRTFNLQKFPGESPMVLTMVHDLYATLALVNRNEPTRFSAQAHHTDNGEVDLMLAQLQWENGMIASFAASFMTSDGTPNNGYDHMDVFGKGWSARIRPNPRPIEVWDTQARWPLALEIRADPSEATGMLAEELRCFCRVIRGLQEIPLGATYADGMQIQQWMHRLESYIVKSD